jgi:hypothetical protein
MSGRSWLRPKSGGSAIRVDDASWADRAALGAGYDDGAHAITTKRR